MADYEVAENGQLAPPANGLAIASLVLGIVAFCCAGLLASIPAIICGHMAVGRIKKSGGRDTGGGLAVAGLILGYIDEGVLESPRNGNPYGDDYKIVIRGDLHEVSALSSTEMVTEIVQGGQTRAVAFADGHVESVEP